MDEIARPDEEVVARQSYWHLARCLMRGTEAMRAAGELYLPRFRNEDDAAYRRRLSVSVLHAGFATIVRTMSGLPFARDIQFGDDVPEVIRGTRNETGVSKGGWIEEIDDRGRHVRVFAHSVFRMGLAYGSSHILVDMPPAEPGTTAVSDLVRRPRWIAIKPWQLLGAETGSYQGRQVFSRIRIHETASVDGRPTQQIREIEPPLWRLWRQQKGQWHVVQESAYDMPFVTLVPFLPSQTDDDDNCLITARSPLENVAHLNVAHWQSASDQRNILSFSRFAIMVLRGVRAADNFHLGPQTVVSLEDPAADAKLLEPSGSAIAAGERDLERLEAQMEAEGLRLLVRRPGVVTATESVIDESKDRSDLEVMTGLFQDVLETALGYTAQWAGLEDGGSVALNTDFGVVPNAPSIQTSIFKLLDAGALSRADAIDELKRARLLSDALDTEGAIERAEADLMHLAPRLPASDTDETARADDAERE